MRKQSRTVIPNDFSGTRALRCLLAGVFLVSFSLLALEISLARVLSVLLSYHYVFVLVSLALLGLGLGAVFAHWRRRKLTLSLGQSSPLAVLAGLISLSMSLSLVISIPIAAYNDQGAIILYAPLLFTPFFFGGAFMASVFRSFPTLASRLYGFDLLGAATGAIGAIFLLNMLGGTRTIAIISLVPLLSAVILAVRSARRPKAIMRPAIALLIIAGVLGSVVAGSGFTNAKAGISQDKEMNGALYDPSLGAEIIETRWSAFGRTDLVALKNQPEQMLLFLDGTAGTPMYQLGGDVGAAGPAIQALKTQFPAYLSLANLKPTAKNNALIIGPGGGRDVLLALMAGTEKVTAVEVNQDLVDIVRKYSSYNGGIYNRNDVNIIVDEGRSFLRRQNERYDLIMLSLPITKTSRSVDGYALTENFLFTTESMSDYLDHLSDNGQIVVVAHSPIEIMRLLSISLAALNGQGVSNQEALKRIYVIGSHHFPVFVMKKTPFEPNELFSVHGSIHQLGYDPSLSYIPTIKTGSCTPHESGVRYDECGMLDPVLSAMRQGVVSFVDLASFFEAQGLNIKPVTDDSPFFYKAEEGIPLPVRLIFWVSTLTLTALFAVPLFRRKRTLPIAGRSKLKVLKFLAFFTILGIGFMLVELSIFQRFVLFLGQPVLSLAILLASLLVGGGIGSLASGRFASRPARVIVLASAGIVLALLTYNFAMPALFGQLLGAGLATRVLVTAAMIMPLGFIMGFPFPSGMTLLKEAGLEDYVPWVWGVNGVASVVGSAGTIMIAMTYGFSVALLAGATCYLVIVGLLGRDLLRKGKTTVSAATVS